MRKITLETKLNKPLCLALGFFDSVHLGHRALLQQTVARAAQYGAYAGVATFSNNLYSHFAKDGKLIYTFAEREVLLQKLGLDVVLPFQFDAAFQSIEAKDFFSMLTGAFTLQSLTCGYDYRFGKNGEGTAIILKEFCEKKGIMCDIVQKISLQDDRISSTRIKQFLQQGKIEQANLLLGDPFFIIGTVERGRGVGHLFGMPTANLSINEDKLLPAAGVYATYCIVDGRRFKSVTNIGAKPTFGEMTITVETLLSDCNENLYGKQMQVEFVKYLRPIRKFENPEQLSRQIHSDADWNE